MSGPQTKCQTIVLHVQTIGDSGFTDPCLYTIWPRTQVTASEFQATGSRKLEPSSYAVVTGIRKLSYTFAHRREASAEMK